MIDRLLERGDFIIIGDAPSGVDDFAWKYLRRMAHWAHWRRERAHWTTLGRAAGHERNGRMLDGADLLIAIFAPGDRTPGTSDCLAQAIARKIPAYVFHEGRWALEWASGDPSSVTSVFDL